MDACLQDFYKEDIIGTCSKCGTAGVKIIKHCVNSYVDDHIAHMVVLACMHCKRFNVGVMRDEKDDVSV